MTTRDFIASLTFVAPSVRERLCEEFEEEINEELTGEVQDWILERVEDLWEMFMNKVRKV